MTIHEYYAELQNGVVCCGVVEDTNNKIFHFYGGLMHDIQDIVDCKKFTIVNHLFRLSMLAEKEFQGRQQREKRLLHAQDDNFITDKDVTF